MKKLLYPLLAAVALTLLASCAGSSDVPTELSIVPNPVSMQVGGRGAKASATVRTTCSVSSMPWVSKIQEYRVMA